VVILDNQVERSFRKISVKYIKKFQKEKDDKAISPDEFYTTIVDSSSIRQDGLENEDKLKMGRLWDKYNNLKK